MKPLALIILDGWGISNEIKGNAIANAKTPTINQIEKNYPAISLQASGIAIGLPWNEAGSSEVGHLTMGAGRVIYQSLPRIVFAIKDGSFFENPALLNAIEHAKKNNSCLHLIGLVSSGNVHSYIDHIYALIELAKKESAPQVRLHVFTDGEDSPLKEAANFLKNISHKLKELENGKIATVVGRFYAMDRSKNWERTQKAYECLTGQNGLKYENPTQAIQESYKQGKTDSSIEPAIIIDKKTQSTLGSVKDNDSVIFFNFREDRARQLTKAFVLDDFKEFPRKQLKNLYFATMSQYEEALPTQVAFPPIEIKNHLTEVLSNYGKKILKIAETEKYAHVTYFFNGGKETIYPNEKRILIPSKTIPHYDKYPEMAVNEIADKIIEDMEKYDLVVANFANCDMVAHTGNFSSTIKAVEAADACLKPILKLAAEKKYCLIITADHGNAEEMINLQTGEPSPEHSKNPVPFYLVNEKYKKTAPTKIDLNYPMGILADVAPTILELMDIPQPLEMTGKSLLENVGRRTSYASKIKS